MYIRERAVLGVENPVIEDFSAPITESLLADVKIKEVRAIYPLIKAINSGRLTRNFTFYPAESLIGKHKPDGSTGYSSFVKPYGKPIIREHQAQNIAGMMGPVESADIPMGRIVYSGFKRYQEKRDGPRTTPSKKYIPGTVEGDGSLFVVPAITDPEAIVRILGGAYHTVSIGSKVDNVWESISGNNIAELRRSQKELPPYERGQLYDGKLSYWRMGEIKGAEVSFVNVPSDEYAGVVDPDIGVEGIKLLVAEKRGKEVNFFDAKTAEKVSLDIEGIWDESFFVDSLKVGQDIWWLNQVSEVAEVTEAVKEELSGEEPENGIIMEKEKLITPTDEVEVIETPQEELKEEVLEALEEVPVTELLTPTVTTIFGELAEKLVNVEPILEYSFTFEGKDGSEAFRLATDEAMERNQNEWNLDSAHLAIHIFMEKGGEISFTKEVKYTPYLGKEEEKTVFYPLFVKKGDKILPLLTIRSKEELNSFAKSLRTYNENYNFWNADQTEEIGPLFAQELEKATSLLEGEDVEDFKGFIELKTENLVHFILKNEFKENKDLATLVGLIRKKEIKKQDLEEAYTAYNVFGTSVLKKFLESTPEREEVIVEPPVEVETETVEILPNPVAAADQTIDGLTKKESKEDVWFGITIKQSGKKHK